MWIGLVRFLGFVGLVFVVGALVFWFARGVGLGFWVCLGCTLVGVVLLRGFVDLGFYVVGVGCGFDVFCDCDGVVWGLGGVCFAGFGPGRRVWS